MEKVCTVRAVMSSDGIHPADQAVWYQNSTVFSICHALGWITGWVLPTQSSWPIRFCYAHVTQMRTLKLWGDEYFIVQYQRAGKLEARSLWPQILYFFPIDPSFPKVPKETFMIFAILLLTWTLRDPAKCLSRVHLGKITLVYILVSASFTRFLSDIFKMQLTSLHCDGHLLGIPQLRTQLIQVKGLR